MSKSLLKEIGFNDAVLVYQGTNTIYRYNDICIRIMDRLDEKVLQQANYGAVIANKIHSINKLLTIECLEVLDNVPVQLWRWRDSAPAEYQQAIDGVAVWRKLAERIVLDAELENKLNQWSGPMRSVPKYMETMNYENRKFVDQQYSLMIDWSQDLLENSDNYIMHGDLNSGNILQDSESVFLVDWDCICLGPEWADWIKMLTYYPQLKVEQCSSDARTQLLLAKGKLMGNLASVSYQLWISKELDNPERIQQAQHRLEKYKNISQNQVQKIKELENR
jgi:hypothetical protein